MMIAHIITYLHARRLWRWLALGCTGFVACLWAYAKARRTSQDHAAQALDDRAVELAEDVAVVHAQHVAELKAVKARDDIRRAEVVAAATDPDRAARLQRLANLLGQK